MSCQKSDILVEIPYDQWSKVADLYKEKATWAPYMVGFIHTCMKWKKLGKYPGCITFTSPNNTWEKDGTIIVIRTHYSQDIFVFTFDNYTNLYQGLMETNLIDYSNKMRMAFYGLHEKHIPTVKKYIQEKNLKITDDIVCYMYVIEPEKARQFTAECPSDVYVKKLEPSAAKQVNDVWPHRFPGSEEYLASYIEVDGGYGVFEKSTGQMVAWVLKQAFGHFAMLQTAEGHQRKGYASLLTKVISKEIGEEEHWPFGSVVLKNNKSIGMFEKLGFWSLGICTFFIVE